MLIVLDPAKENENVEEAKQSNKNVQQNSYEMSRMIIVNTCSDQMHYEAEDRNNARQRKNHNRPNGAYKYVHFFINHRNEWM